MFMITPEFIAGVFAAEGNFSISPNETWYRPHATFVLNKVDGELVYMVRDFFNMGKNVRERPAKGNDGPLMEWETQSITDAKVLVQFFNQYSLLNNKQLSFNLWVECIDLLDKFQFITDKKEREQGYVDIMYYREVLNPYGRDLIYTLNHAKKLYPNANFVQPERIAQIQTNFTHFQEAVLPTIKLDPNFVAGYVTGDGGSKCGWKAPAKGKKTPTFDWDMNVVSIDPYIIHAFKSFFNAGNIYTYRNKKDGNLYYRLMITNRKDFIRIYEDIFCEYPLFGKKAIDYYLLYRCCLALESKLDRFGPISQEIRDELNYCINERSKNVYY